MVEIIELDEAYQSGSDNVIENQIIAQEYLLPDLNRRRGRELPNEERRVVYETLLKRSRNGVLKRSDKKEIAPSFGVDPRTIQRIWKRATESPTNDYRANRVQRCGRPKIVVDLEQIRNLPLASRTTIASLAAAIGVSHSFIGRRIRDGTIRRHTNAIKPLLTPANRVARIKHCLASLDPSSLPHAPMFMPMHNVVHIDEKWFYLTKRHETYYLLADEEDSIRSTKSSKFIEKIMFIAAVARPRFDSDGNCTFDGKIGIFPLVEDREALRNSKYRPRGTIEVKPIPVVDRKVIRSFLIDKIIPAIAGAWPLESFGEEIFIQQDNCRTHILVNDEVFLDAVKESGLNLKIFCQPPNSPDMNILDLGFFRSIQSLQTKNCSKNAVALIAAVHKAFDDFSPKSSNRLFLTLQSCMVEVLQCGGSNKYKIPHMKKNQLEREGRLPLTLSCPTNLYVELSAIQ